LSRSHKGRGETDAAADQAAAVTTGATSSSRKSSVANSIASLAGVTRTSGPWANLANLSNDQELQGTGTTSRTNTLNTTLSAEVSAVTANGNLIVEGRKAITVNGEKQIVLVRGTVRPDDVSPANTVTSAQIANLEVSVNGKGVVGDAVRRPFILYRLLLGLLPF
jgi:flagellar L-ring protein precursor FlgH